MLSFLTRTPVLMFLFLFNLVVAVLAAVTMSGFQGVVTAIAMGVVSLGAGTALLSRRLQRA